MFGVVVLIVNPGDWLNLSVIASAKGCDAPIVFLLGADHLRSDRTEDRALFYVGATRAKPHLVVTGVKTKVPALLDEAEKAARVFAGGREALLNRRRRCNRRPS
jgi:superfamily I DNA/RNA helicase